MSAADRMVVRTAGGYRSLPRRVALAMISAGRATADPAATRASEPAVLVEPVEPHDDEYQLPGGVAPTVVDAGDANDTPTPPQEYDPALDERRRVAGLRSGEWRAVRGPITYPVPVAEPAQVDVPTVEAVELPAPPRGNAGRRQWAEYAQEHLGLEVTSSMTRNEIRDAALERLESLARLPQPALEGGRLDTPEDEPVTDGSVTDDEDPRT